SSFQPTEEFRTQAEQRIGTINSVSVANDSKVSANLLAERLAYPMTMFAMVLVVYAFGHLMSYSPNQLQLRAANPDFDFDLRPVVSRTLTIVALLSIADLIWTLVASQQGSMRELNPLGSQLIDNPVYLIVFKTLATGTAIGCLYHMRDRPIAHIASWWSCLVLTLLTARWLTFHSMLV
ncbi:MAG: hypothetical protein HKN47_10555, partial [Pirellulaceae bacterium]|nr:hypothetical protein [Pirellulaceae bacterium]